MAHLVKQTAEDVIVEAIAEGYAYRLGWTAQEWNSKDRREDRDEMVEGIRAGLAHAKIDASILAQVKR